MSETVSPVLQYPRRHYKTVYELDKCTDNKIFLPEPTSLSTIDERVHASTEGSKIVEFLKEKSILIVGGTGFIGKLLIEKLLRSCRNIKKIYIIVRAKRGQDAASRMEVMFDNVVFAELHKVFPNFRNKIVLVEGDLALPNIGLNERDRNLLEREVSILIHAAATVNFKQELKVSANINIEGTQEVLKLAKRCQQLVSFVYVSTAYSNCHLRVIEEKFYDPPYTDDELWRLIDDLGENLEEKKELILGKWPNTYVFTKAIAEHVVQKHAKDLPACIFRPGIIVATHKEPIRSWIDNYYGSVGVVANAFRGVTRTFLLRTQVVGDIVPADYVVNGIIAAAYNNHFRRDRTTKIYNFISSPENPITHSDFLELSSFYGQHFPTMKVIWYPYSSVSDNIYMHFFWNFFSHILPALLIDLYLLMKGAEAWAFPIYRKLHKFNESLTFFGVNSWIFSNNNTQQLWLNLSEVDRKIYYFSMAPENLNWNEYLSTLCCGIRVYLFRDDLVTLPAARNKHKRA